MNKKFFSFYNKLKIRNFLISHQRMQISQDFSFCLQELISNGKIVENFLDCNLKNV